MPASKLVPTSRSEEGQRFPRRLRSHGLELVGLHVGGDYLNAGAAADDVSRARQVVEAIHAAGGRYIMVSGARPDMSGSSFAAEAERLNRIAAGCKGLDVQVCYHNHFGKLPMTTPG